MRADHIVMECAHRPPGELEAFKELRPEIGFGLGVVDIKATDVESADHVARAIELQKQAIEKSADGRMKDEMKTTLAEYEAALKKA